MKKLLRVVFLILGFGPVNINSQVTSTYSVLSTAYNRAASSFYPLGNVDGYWFLTRMEDMVVPGNPASVVLYPNNPTYVVPNAGNNTFPGIIANHSINTNATTASLGLKVITYRTYFTLPNLNLTSNRYSLSFKMSADDAVDNVKLNGTKKAVFLDANYNNIPGINKPYLLTIPICDTDFVSGQNFIDVTIADAGNLVGFYGEVILYQVTNSSNTQMAVASSCNGASGSAVATLTTTVVNPSISYTWINPGGAIVSQTNNTASLANSVINLPNGTYTVQTRLNASCNSIITETVTINCSVTTPTAVCGGKLTGMGMGNCNQYNFTISPTQTITPLNYGSQGYACTGATMPDVSFNIMGGSWRVMKNNWDFTATTSGQIRGFDGAGILQVIPFLASNTITPLSYSGSMVQFAINGSAAGALLSQANFSISLDPLILGGSTYTYCPSIAASVTISPVSPASGGPWTYNWQPGNIPGNPINVNPVANTNYTVTASTSAGCTSTANVVVTVTCVNTPSASCPGSLLLDAAHPSVDLPVSNQYYTGTNGGYTWECWFKLNQPFGSTPRPLICATDGVLFEDQWLGFGWQGGWFDEPVNKLVFKVDGPNSTNPSGPNCAYAPPGGFLIGTWYHAAGVMNYATQTSKLFVNGLLVDSKTVSTPPITRNIATGLCLNSGSGTLPLFGNMDEVRIWTRALSDNEVMTNYNQCLFGTEQHLLLYYRCNQPGGSTVIDETINHVTGTFPNTPGWSTDQPGLTGLACSSTTTLTATSRCRGINSSATGTITTTVVSPVVSYTWSNSSGIISQTNNTNSLVDSVTNLAPGIYTLTAQITTPCRIITNTQTVTVSLPLIPSVSITNANCSSSTGAVTIIAVTNGIPAYVIKEGGTTIASGVTVPYTISGISVGTHTYEVINSGGCSTTFTAFVQQGGIPPDLNVVSPVQLDCVHETTLTATTTSGATSFSWAGPFISSGASSSSVVINQIGNYSVTLTQGVCSNSAIVSVIPNVNTPTITVIPPAASICPGATATLSAFGASTYTWSASTTLSGSTGNTVVANPAATTSYSVIGTSNSCTAIAVTTVSVLSTPTLAISSNTSICRGATATLTATGGDSYSWNNPSSLSSPTGSMVIASPGTTTNYTVTGTRNTCANTAIVTVSVNPSPTITAVSLIHTSCGLANGSATLSSLPSGNTYSWSLGVTSVTNEASSLAAGNYSITVINGICTADTVITILNSIPLLITSHTVVPSGCNLNDGSIHFTDNLAGSTYSWNPGVSVTNSAGNLTPGNYSITITNGACNTSTVFVVGLISGPTDITTAIVKPVCGSSNGAVTITGVVNGIAPYQYNFNNTGFSSVLNYPGLPEGTYALSVKDHMGCLYTDFVVVNDTTIGYEIDLETNAPNCLANDGSFFVNGIAGGTPPYLLSLNYGPFSNKVHFEPLGQGTYTLTVMDSNRCETPFVLTMTENKGDYTLYIPNSFTPNKDRLNDIWYIQGTCLGEISCTIYNRWGEKLIEINDISNGWDGTYKGAEVPEGVYVYSLKAQTETATITKTGHINLIR